MFLLEQSWFFMSFVYRIFGICPLEKIGEADLKPTSGCCFWFRYLFTMTLVMLITGGPIVYATNFQDFLIALVADIAVTVYDKISLIATALAQSSLHVTCLIKLGSIKKRFSDFQHFLNTTNSLEPKDSPNSLKIFKYLLPFLFFVMITTIFTYIGWIYSIGEKLNLSSFETNLIMLPFWIFNTFILTPLFYFMTLYIEVTIKLSHLCKNITNKSSTIIVEEAKIFMSILKEFASMFSSLLLWIISVEFVFSIIVGFFLYVKGTITFSSVDVQWYDYCPIIGYASMMVYLICIFYISCTLSEDIANEVQNLKLEISKRGYEHEQVDYVLRELEEFKGFDANGYFTLNHSLLTGMATNFATFLVILIQFKQAETPSR